MTTTTPISVRAHSIPWRPVLAAIAAIVLAVILFGFTVGWGSSAATQPSPSVPITHTNTDQLQDCRPAHPC
jgi:hypothetical protein